MTKYIIICLVCCIHFNSSFAQTFHFRDTAVSVGSQMIWRQIYSPNCQIELEYLPLIDSLAKFLIKNDKIIVAVEFHGDTQESNEYEQKRGEICGGKRMSSIMRRDYTMIGQERILHKFPGNSEPLYTQEVINEMQSEKEKIKAHAANCRTVVKIVKTGFVH